MSDQQHASATLYQPGKTRYLFYRRLGGPQVRSGQAKYLVPTGIRSRTVQPVVSRYTDWATRPKFTGVQGIIFQNTITFTDKIFVKGENSQFVPLFALLKFSYFFGHSFSNTFILSLSPEDHVSYPKLQKCKNLSWRNNKCVISKIYYDYLAPSMADVSLDLHGWSFPDTYCFRSNSLRMRIIVPYKRTENSRFTWSTSFYYATPHHRKFKFQYWIQYNKCTTL